MALRLNSIGWIPKRWWLVIPLSLLALFLAHCMALIYRIQPAVSLWFPPSGVAIALTLWFGPIEVILTGVMACLMAPQWGNDGWTQILGLTDATEPLVAWWLYRYRLSGSLAFKSLRDAVAFILSAPLAACATSAVLGSLALTAVGKMTFFSLISSVLHWWLGNAIGTMAITPAALLVLTPFLHRWGYLPPSCTAKGESMRLAEVQRNRETEETILSPSPTPPLPVSSQSYRLEVLVILIVSVSTAVLTVSETNNNNFVFQQLSFLSFIPILWAATRFGVTGGMLTSSFCVLMTLLAYLITYPNAISLPNFPVQATVLHVHKLSLLVQCAVSLLVGCAMTERAVTLVALITERVRAGEYQARVQLNEQLIRLNRSLAEANARLEESNLDKDELLKREQIARADSEVARSTAEAANRIKDEFLSTLSHELRSPLNPILGWVTLLRTRKLDEATTARALETIERNAQLQTQLVEDLLDISRIMRGKLSLNISPVNLASVIESAIDTVQLAAVAKSIQMELDIHPSVELVAGDANRLQQVVWNLLSNAVKFTPEGGRVEIRLESLGSHAQLQVSDNGSGIKADFLPHIFDYFRQADASVTRKYGGLGLGLAIVRQLVELHGGTVEAKSPGEGQGATFTVKLPLLEGSKSAREQKSQKAESIEPNSHLFLSNVRVLVVDDEADTREYLSFLLEQSGAKTMAVASADEGLEAIRQFKPDVLVSDIGMPEEDGYTFLGKVRSLLPEECGAIPAVALTAYARQEDIQQALLAGFQVHIAKPIKPVELIAAVTNLAKNSAGHF